MHLLSAPRAKFAACNAAYVPEQDGTESNPHGRQSSEFRVTCSRPIHLTQCAVPVSPDWQAGMPRLTKLALRQHLLQALLAQRKKHCSHDHQDHPHDTARA